MTADWLRKFDEPITLPKGHQLVTLKDAGTYITKLPKAEHMTPEWQAAMPPTVMIGAHSSLHALAGRMRPALSASI